MRNRLRLEQLRVGIALSAFMKYNFSDRCNFKHTYRALADVLYIYPLKKDKKTFDANKEELGFASKTKNQGKQAIEDIPPDRLTEE